MRIDLVAVIETCQIVVKPLGLPVLFVVANDASSLYAPNQLAVFFNLLNSWLHTKRIGTVASRALGLIRNQPLLFFAGNVKSVTFSSRLEPSPPSFFSYLRSLPWPATVTLSPFAMNLVDQKVNARIIASHGNYFIGVYKKRTYPHFPWYAN